jgi:hippurate hydrolase
MASSNRWDIVIRGVGGHAAMPNRGIDPVVISAEVVQALQSVISRRRDPLDPAVLSITQIHAGDAYNVIPNEVVLRGTVRTFTIETLDQIQDDMQRIVTSLPQVYGATGELTFFRSYPAVVNHAKETAFAAQVAREAFGAENVDENTTQLMAAEDFSFYLQKVPGAYLFLGNGEGDHREASYHGMGPCQLHNSNYDFNDALLPVGATYWVKLVEAFFKA